jgi:hypothetical protein
MSSRVVQGTCALVGVAQLKLAHLSPCPLPVFIWLPALSDDPEVLPLDQWVFNTEAHPFPIWGTDTETRVLKAAGITPLDL